MRARLAVFSTVLVVCAVAACGTTVPPRDRPTQAAGGDGVGRSEPAGAWPAAVPTAEGRGRTDLASPPGSVSSARAAQAGTGVLGETSRAAGTADVHDALLGEPGITARTVQIGFETAGNAAATRAVFGLPDPQTPPIADALKIIFDHVNSTGGFGGRKGEFVIHETDIAEGNFDTQSAATCSAFTEDHRVFAAVSSVSRTPTIFTCLAKHRTIGFAYYPGLAIPLSSWDRLADYLYGPVYVAHPRASILVDTWVRMGLLTKGSRIGLISIDEPTRQAFAQAIRDGLKGHGLTLTDEFRASDSGQLADLGRASQEMSSAVIQFRAHDVDVVLFANTAGGGPSLFMPVAETQRYYPRYGLSSYEFLRTLVSLVPTSALQRSVGPGWLPDYDITEASHLPKNPDRDLCLAIFRRGGLTVTGTTAIQINSVCQVVFLIRDAMSRVSLGKARSFREAVESLGRYPTADSDPLLFAPGRRHDAIGEYREMRFNTECACFVYTTGPRPIP